MGNGPKIVIIGGGSHQWVPTLVTDTAAVPLLADAHLALVDLDESRLPRMARWVEHVAKHRGVGLTASTHTDRREALADADYVLICISTGGLATMAQDLAVPERYGFRQSVGDTVGPGGVSRALRNIPVMAAIASDVSELAPNAWIVNVTNPMTTLTRTIAKTSDVNVVGLCHEVVIAEFWLSLLLECSSHDLDPTIVGVNHLPLAVELTRRDSDGNSHDALAELRDLIDDDARLDMALDDWVGDLFRDEFMVPGAAGVKQWDPSTPFTKRSLVEFNGPKFDLFRHFGALPLAGDRHTVEFFPGFLTESSHWGGDWGVALTTTEMRQKEEDNYVAKLEARLASDDVEQHVSMESAMPLIASLMGGEPSVLPVNIPNDGSLPDLPLDVVIETMAVIDEIGITPQRNATAPPFFAEHLRRLSASQELTIEAALTGDRDLVLAAFMTDPFASRIDYAQLRQMADELIEANKAYLPQFS